MAITDFFGKALRRKPKAEVDAEGKPVQYDSLSNMPYPIDSYINTTGTLEKVPIFSFSWRWMYDLAYSSDVFSTIIRAINDEVFRAGIEIKEKFKTKCEKCGREFEEDVEECRYCGGKTRYPDYKEYERLLKFSNSRNPFGDNIIASMKYVNTDVDIGDNGFIFVAKDYRYQEKRLIGYTIHNIMRLSPSKMRLIYSRWGMGRNEVGEYIYFCPQHRSDFKQYAEETEDTKCEQCGLQMMQAWFVSRDKDGLLYYGKDEIYHVKRWSHNEGYGVPPTYAIWGKVMTLMKMDRFMLDAYSLQRSPKALLILRGKIESVRRSWLQLMTEARGNPNMIYPLVIEGEDNQKRVMEYQPLDLKPEEMQWIDNITAFRTQVGLFYGVQPLFSQGPGGGGLNNEGLQITVTNRTIRESQRVWNNFLTWLSELLGCQDYAYKLVSNELTDELRGHEVEEQRLRIASTIAQFGYNIEIHRDARGFVDFEFIKSEEQMPVNGDGMPNEEGTNNLPKTKAEEYEGGTQDESDRYDREEASNANDYQTHRGKNVRGRGNTVPGADGKRSGGGKDRERTKRTKVYLHQGEQAPAGAQVVSGRNGGRYYIAEGYWHSRDSRKGFSKANYKDKAVPNNNPEEQPRDAVEVDTGNVVNRKPKRKLLATETEETAGGGNEGVTVDTDVASLPYSTKDIPLKNKPYDDEIQSEPNEAHQTILPKPRDKRGLAAVDENGEIQHHGGANDTDMSM